MIDVMHHRNCLAEQLEHSDHALERGTTLVVDMPMKTDKLADLQRERLRLDRAAAFVHRSFANDDYVLQQMETNDQCVYDMKGLTETWRHGNDYVRSLVAQVTREGPRGLPEPSGAS